MKGLVIIISMVIILVISTQAFAEKYIWEKEVVPYGGSDYDWWSSIDVYEDRVGIAYPSSYVEKNGSSGWNFWSIGSEYQSLKFNPITHNAEIGSSYTDVKFSQFNGSVWNTATLRSGTYPNSSSLAYDPIANLPVITYSAGNSYPGSATILKYNGINWVDESLPNSNGRGVNLDYSSDGKAVVAFMNENLKVARQQEDDSWVTDTVDYTATMYNLGGSHVSVEFDKNNNLYTAYASSDPAGGNLYFASFDGTNWTTEMIRQSGGITRADLHFDSQNNPIILFGRDTADIKIGYKTNGIWQFESIDDFGYGLSNLIVDENDVLHLAYLSRDHQLIYATGASVVPEPASLLLFGIGGLATALIRKKR